MIIQQEVQINLKSLDCITMKLEYNFDNDKSKYNLPLFIFQKPTRQYIVWKIISRYVKHQRLDIWTKACKKKGPWHGPLKTT